MNFMGAILKCSVLMTSDFNTRVSVKSLDMGWFIMKELCLTGSNTSISLIFYVIIFKGGNRVT